VCAHRHRVCRLPRCSVLATRRRSTTADAPRSEHRAAGKSTYAVSMSTHGGNVETVPSKASLDQRDEGARRSNGLRDVVPEDQADGRQYRSAAVHSGRPGHRQQPVVEGYRDRSINLEWRDPQQPSQDGPQLRSHMRPREHRRPARSHSYASSDISSSIETHSSVEQDHDYVELIGRRSSSDATPTEDDNARPYRGRKTVPTSREPVRRSASLPTSDDVDEPAGRPRHHVVETRQQNPVMYAGRSKAPVSGRQKIKRTTETPDNEDEQPRSGYMYVDDIQDRQPYERARRQRQAPSTRPRLNHDLHSSSSPDDTQVGSGRFYGDRKTMATNDEEDDVDEVDVAVQHRSERRPPTGRTGTIQRSGDADVRVTSSSPRGARRVATPSSIDDKLYRQMQNRRTNASYTRRAPAGRTKAIHHGSTGNLDINIIDGSPDNVRTVSNRETPDGQRTPTSSTDWLRHQRSGRLTVDVEGHDGDSPSLHRAYRSMPDLMDDDGYTDEIVPTRRPPNYTAYDDDDNVSDSSHPHHARSSNPDSRTGGRVTTTIWRTSTEPRGAEELDASHRPRCLSSSGTEQSSAVAGVVARKRGVITGATVESRGRSGRTNDMASTDVEDLDVKSSHVARIYVGDEDELSCQSQDDAMSVFSEPPTSQRGRPSAVLTPAYRPSPPPPTVPRGTFELAHVDTQIHQPPSPDVASPEPTISAVDPALRGASRHGTNYHIMLTLRPTVSAVAPPPRQNTVTSRSQPMTSAMTSPSQTPRAVSSMAVHDDPGRTGVDPGRTGVDRGLTCDEPGRPGSERSVRRRGSPSTRGAGRGTAPRARSRSATRPTTDGGQIRFDVEVRDDERVNQHSSSTSTTRQMTVDPGPQVGSVEFNYSPPDDDQRPVNYSRRQAPPSGRHRQPPPRHSDDEMKRSRHPRSQRQQPQPSPDIQRGNFIVINSHDTTKPPKVGYTFC